MEVKPPVEHSSNWPLGGVVLKGPPIYRINDGGNHSGPAEKRHIHRNMHAYIDTYVFYILLWNNNDFSFKVEQMNLGMVFTSVCVFGLFLFFWNYKSTLVPICAWLKYFYQEAKCDVMLKRKWNEKIKEGRRRGCQACGLDT